jgi:WD40 repeat protein
LPWVLDVAFDPSSSSGSQLVASVAPTISTLPGELQLWNLNSEKIERLLPVDPDQKKVAELKIAPARFNSLKFNHNGSLLVAGSSDGMIRVYDASRSGAIMGWPAFSGGLGVGALCLSHSETSVIAVSSDGSAVAEWSLHRLGEVIRKFSLPVDDMVSRSAQPQFSSASISLAGKRLAVAARGNATIMSFTSETADEVVERFTLPRVSSVDWDENILLCGGSDGTVATYTL